MQAVEYGLLVVVSAAVVARPVRTLVGDAFADDSNITEEIAAIAAGKSEEVNYEKPETGWCEWIFRTSISEEICDG